MTKREDVKSALFLVISEAMLSNFDEEDLHPLTDKALAMLDALGVVIKVDKGLPQNPYEADVEAHKDDNEPATIDDVYCMAYNGFGRGVSTMLKAGYVAVEPLVKDD